MAKIALLSEPCQRIDPVWPVPLGRLVVGVPTYDAKIVDCISGVAECVSIASAVCSLANSLTSAIACCVGVRPFGLPARLPLWPGLNDPEVAGRLIRLLSGC